MYESVDEKIELYRLLNIINNEFISINTTISINIQLNLFSLNN